MNCEFGLCVFLEAINERGEDGEPVVVPYQKTVAMGVFDGLGGRSAGYDGMTGGKIASSLASRITKQFLQQRYGHFNEQDITQLQKDICNLLKTNADTKIKQSRLQGTMAGKRLCTTLALVSISYITPANNSFRLSLGWIGDSRIYFLSPTKGLQQLTKDDLTIENDAFKLIREDPPMSQYLTADMNANWRINFKTEEFSENGCVLACTDGCFQYLESPWAFEKLLLETLIQCQSFTDWQNLLLDAYTKIKQDDVSLVLRSVGFESFHALQDSYKQRFAIIRDRFSYQIDDYQKLETHWSIYKQNYEEKIKSEYLTTKYNQEPLVSHHKQSQKVVKTSEYEDEQQVKVNDTFQQKSFGEDREQLNKKEVVKLLEQGDKYWKMNSYQLAIYQYSNALRLDPDNCDTEWKLGCAYTELGFFEQKVYVNIFKSRHHKTAVNFFEKALSNPYITKTSEDKYIYLKALLGDRNYDKVIQVCHEIIQNVPNCAYAFHVIGYSQKQQDLLEIALENLLKAKELYQVEQKYQQVQEIDNLCNEIEKKLKAT